MKPGDTLVGGLVVAVDAEQASATVLLNDHIVSYRKVDGFWQKWSQVPFETANWYIDPNGVLPTTSDSNDGLSPGTARRTFASLDLSHELDKPHVITFLATPSPHAVPPFKMLSSPWRASKKSRKRKKR
jgi:hypothetical protein